MESWGDAGLMANDQWTTQSHVVHWCDVISTESRDPLV